MFFAVRMLKRSPFITTCTIIISAFLGILLCYVVSNEARLEKQLEQVINNFEIKCVVSNLQGTQTSSLQLPITYIEGVTLDAYGMTDYIQNLSLTKEFRGQDSNGVLWNVHGVNTSLCAEQLNPSFNGGIHLFEEYKYDFFNDTDNVCLISSSTAKLMNGQKHINLLLLDPFQKGNSLSLTLKIVGTYPGESDIIYVPWKNAITYMQEASGIITCDRMHFWIKDNHLISEFAQIATKAFSKVDPEGKQSIYSYALIIHDEQYQTTLSGIRQSISHTKLLLPILNALGIIAGFFISLLQMKNHKNTFYLLRSLGSSKKDVFIVSMYWQFLPSVIGASIGTTLSIFIFECNWVDCFECLCFYLLWYLIGCVFVIHRISNLNLMNIREV